MIDFLLATCTYLIKRQPVQALARLQALDIWQVGISTITLSELEYGVSKSSKLVSDDLQGSGVVVGVLLLVEFLSAGVGSERLQAGAKPAPSDYLFGIDEVMVV